VHSGEKPRADMATGLGGWLCLCGLLAVLAGLGAQAKVSGEERVWRVLFTYLFR